MDLEKILLQFSNDNLLARLYKLLMKSIVVVNSAKTKREWDLQMELKDKDWEYISKCFTKVIVNVAMREHHYKLMCQWYLIPRKLVQMYMIKEERCWRCGLTCDIFACLVEVSAHSVFLEKNTEGG